MGKEDLKRAGLPALFSHLARPWLCVFCILFCLLTGCQENQKTEVDDISLAEDAMRRRDIGDAEMYFERYLRRNPQGELRLHVWEQLLNISLDLRQDRSTAKEYFEIMLMEFSEEPERKREIQWRLATLCNEMREYARAGELWEELAKDQGTPDRLKAIAYTEVSHVYLRRLEFIAATDILKACLELDVDTETKAGCLYALGDAQSLTEDLSGAEASLRDILELSGISEERRVLTIFMLADVLEQQGRYDSAISYFESILSSYPNEKVVEMRITHLKKIRK